MSSERVLVLNKVTFERPSGQSFVDENVGILQTTKMYSSFKMFGLRTRIDNWQTYRSLVGDKVFKKLPIWRCNGGDYVFENGSELIGLTHEQYNRLSVSGLEPYTISPDTEWESFYDSLVDLPSTNDFSCHRKVEKSFREEVQLRISSDTDIVFFDLEKINELETYLNTKHYALVVSPSTKHISNKYFYLPR